MRIRVAPVGSACIFLLAGCWGSVADDLGAMPPDAGELEDAYANQPGRPPAPDSVLIHGTVTGSLPSPCQPFGMPITLFLTGTFGLDSLVDEHTEMSSDTQCVHHQTLAGTANTWAQFAYSTLCLGGGDTRLCSTQATRDCSVGMMLRWAEERSEPVVFQGSISEWEYAMPPLEPAARSAVKRRLVQEVQSLIDESQTVIAEHRAHARECPDEDRLEILETYFDALALQRRLSEDVNGLVGVSDPRDDR